MFYMYVLGMNITSMMSLCPLYAFYWVSLWFSMFFYETLCEFMNNIKHYNRHYIDTVWTLKNLYVSSQKTRFISETCPRKMSKLEGEDKSLNKG